VDWDPDPGYEASDPDPAQMIADPYPYTYPDPNQVRNTFV